MSAQTSENIKTPDEETSASRKELQYPNPLLVHKFYREGLKPQILRMALLLNVFSPLRDGPQNAKKVAKACNANETGMSFLLDSLCAFGFLDKNKQEYQLTATSSMFLIPEQASYVGNWVLEQTNPTIFLNMLDTLRNGEPFFPNMPWHELAWLESYDTSRFDESLEMWEIAGIDVNKQNEVRIGDLACGCGITSFAYASCNKYAQITCVDNQKVLDVAQNLAERMDITSQVTYIPQNLHDVEFVDRCYDIVLLSNITNFFSPEKNIDLFQRLYSALEHNGQLIINVTMAPPNMINEHVNLYSLILWAITGTSFYHFDLYKDWLSAAGFVEVKLLSNLWLSAKKAM